MRSGAVAFISGAGRGIGRATAYRFARAGARVVVAARTAAEIEAVAAELSRIGATAIPIVCDVNIVARTGRSPDEARRILESQSPQRRLIDPDEVAAIALFLASDEAHGINGQAINVDGGQVMS